MRFYYLTIIYCVKSLVLWLFPHILLLIVRLEMSWVSKNVVFAEDKFILFEVLDDWLQV